MNCSFGLFQRFGVELEYMIVDAETLDVLPASDRILQAVAGLGASDAEVDDLTWSNELVLHVIELKTREPAARLDGLNKTFHDGVQRINAILAPIGGRLLPTGMHPWMDPLRETRLWPHAGNEVYEAFDRIFGCRGHGWSNVQAAHLNLPFSDDDEFGRLHAAIRLVLPILPALAASTPIAGGLVTGLLDTRLEHYRRNCASVPSLTGEVVPEPVYTRADYESRILARLYDDVALYDPDEVLRYEWLNARGAIARFVRNTIEIRVLDVQECPSADLVVLEIIVRTLRALIEQRWCDVEFQKRQPTQTLADVLRRTVREADRAVVAEENLLRAFGLAPSTPVTAGELWRGIVERIYDANDSATAPAALRTILSFGPLARRILMAVGDDGRRERLHEVYRELARCLNDDRVFVP
ncbi:MAG: glutamate-cysteine ligase family protein [Planctomycetota bacterium]